MTTTTSFTSMDTSTKEQWAVIADETVKNQDRVLSGSCPCSTSWPGS